MAKQRSQYISPAQSFNCCPSFPIRMIMLGIIPTTPTANNYELREDGDSELREDGGYELREI